MPLVVIDILTKFEFLTLKNLRFISIFVSMICVIKIQNESERMGFPPVYNTLHLQQYSVRLWDVKPYTVYVCRNIKKSRRRWFVNTVLSGKWISSRSMGFVVVRRAFIRRRRYMTSAICRHYVKVSRTASLRLPLHTMFAHTCRLFYALVDNLHRSQTR